jgi:transposase-like protein
MDVEVSTNSFMDTNGKRRRNKRWPEALKREIVAATLVPGASVSVVARQYDVNVNQVFGWRHRFGPGDITIIAPEAGGSHAYPVPCRIRASRTGPVAGGACQQRSDRD